MDIDKSKFEYFYFTDINDNKCEKDDPNVAYYHSGFPCMYTETLDSYKYEPRGIHKLLYKLPLINKLYKNKPKSFRYLATFSTHYDCGEETILSMVNSGDYTLGEAIYIYANSCERCANVLENKYNPEKGYKEYSLDWWMTDTRCDFCREEVVYARLVNTNYFSKVVGVAHDNINYKDCGIAIQDKGFVDGEFITKDFNEFVEFKSYRDLTDEEKRSVINNNGNN
jgi:hypothetical protein